MSDCQNIFLLVLLQFCLFVSSIFWHIVRSCGQFVLVLLVTWALHSCWLAYLNHWWALHSDWWAYLNHWCLVGSAPRSGDSLQHCTPTEKRNNHILFTKFCVAWLKSIPPPPPQLWLGLTAGRWGKSLKKTVQVSQMGYFLGRTWYQIGRISDLAAGPDTELDIRLLCK